MNEELTREYTAQSLNNFLRSSYDRALCGFFFYLRISTLPEPTPTHDISKGLSF